MRRMLEHAFVILVVTITGTAFAGELPGRAGGSADHAVIVIADVEHGRALIPEGTVIPAGVTVRVRREATEGRTFVGREYRNDSAPPDQVRPLVFAYAPDASFDVARRAIAVGSATKYRAKADSLRVVPNDFSDIWFYIYFPDIGAYIEQGLRPVSYGYTGASIYIYVPSAMNLMDATLTGSQSSDLPSDPFAASCITFTYNDAGGTCATAFIHGSAITATVTTTGRIQGRTYDGCGYGGTHPCSVDYSGAIHTFFQYVSATDFSYSSTQ